MRTALSAADIDRLYEEDVAYGDLTTHALGLGHSRGRLTLPALYVLPRVDDSHTGRFIGRCVA